MNLGNVKIADSALAEAELEKAGQKPGYALTLLHIVASETFASTTRLAGALCFKNFLKRQWIV